MALGKSLLPRLDRWTSRSNRSHGILINFSSQLCYVKLWFIFASIWTATQWESLTPREREARTGRLELWRTSNENCIMLCLPSFIIIITVERATAWRAQQMKAQNENELKWSDSRPVNAGQINEIKIDRSGLNWNVTDASARDALTERLKGPTHWDPNRNGRREQRKANVRPSSAVPAVINNSCIPAIAEQGVPRAPGFQVSRNRGIVLRNRGIERWNW